jgi:hypothetical protein
MPNPAIVSVSVRLGVQWKTLGPSIPLSPVDRRDDLDDLPSFLTVDHRWPVRDDGLDEVGDLALVVVGHHIVGGSELPVLCLPSG